jgi:hypothetical protein
MQVDKIVRDWTIRDGLDQTGRESCVTTDRDSVSDDSRCSRMCGYAIATQLRVSHRMADQGHPSELLSPMDVTGQDQRLGAY